LKDNYLSLLQSGAIKPIVAKTFPLTEAQTYYNLLMKITSNGIQTQWPRIA
jgi:NADPH:quinone reductase-like Zn-dependent oxidoreductase